MNAIKMLKQQHREVEKLFKQFESAKSAGPRQRTFEEIADALAVHATIEEKHFYPAVKKAQTEDILLESVEEHLEIKRVIADLLEMDADEDEFEAKMKVLQENVEHHVEEEENELFPRVQSTMDDELDDLGTQLAARKRELQSSTTGSVGKAIRGFVNKAFGGSSASESARRPAKRKARTAKSAKTAKTKTARRSASSGQRKARGGTKSKRASAKTSSTAASRSRARSGAAGARKRASGAGKRSVKRARSARAQSSRKRAAARKR